MPYTHVGQTASHRRWHAANQTETGYKTLCGRLLTHGMPKSKRRRVTCKRCRKMGAS